MGFDVQTLILGLTFVAAFASVVAVGLPLLSRDTLQSRLNAVAARREELSARQRAALAQKSARFQPKRHIGVMRAVLDRLRMQNLLARKDVKAKLARAGFRRPSALVTFTFLQMATPLAAMVLAVVAVAAHPALVEKALGVKVLVCAGAGLAGFALPDILLANAMQKRQQILARGFPDALDLMVICVESGLSVEGALARVTEEMQDSAPVIAEEIGLTAAELAFLADRRQAYENLADRTGMPSIKSLATALMQSEKYGTPVSVALRVISQENRDNRMSAAEKKAASLPAKLTVPMIVFFLPVLFMVIISPAAIKVSRILAGQ